MQSLNYCSNTVMELMASMNRDFLPLYEDFLQTYYSHLELLALVGALYIAFKGFSLLHGCYTLISLLINWCLLKKSTLTRRYGEWAVVTGATDGIGKAYAEELASLGMNIILISRNREKLQNVSDSIAKTYGVKTRFIQADFNRCQEFIHVIKDALKDVDVGILVNNAGVCYEYPQYVTEVPEDKMWEIINVNVAAATMMIHVVLPDMVQRKRGAIINISSASSAFLCPLFAIYGASKSFLDYLSQALHQEYASKGIFIQSMIPFFVTTNLIKPMSKHFQTASLLLPDAKGLAYQAVRTIGVTCRTTGNWAHSIQHTPSQTPLHFFPFAVLNQAFKYYFASCLPKWAWICTVTLMFSTIRRQYLARR
uniref:3-ketoacyl-CoA reductase n=1 Tax=Leptobrachium leishanense TaxID=445787 RepID=A0A8C5PKT9_9ANUR